MPDDEVLQRNSNDMSSIEKELTQIRKIALSVINRLADQPTSPQYDTMKKIWNMVDKAIEQPQKGNGNFSD
jgi:predicted transcriptional regulator